MADRLKLSAEITSAGRWNADAEPRAGPKSAHHTSPRPITLPLPVREQANCSLGDERLGGSLLLCFFLGHGLREGGIDLSRDVALLLIGEVVLQRLDKDATSRHAPPTGGTLRGLEEPLRQRDCGLDGPVFRHALSIPVYQPGDLYTARTGPASPGSSPSATTGSPAVPARSASSGVVTRAAAPAADSKALTR